jgi:magnesium transporter
MGSESINFLFLSELLALPVIDAATSRKVGTIIDLAATTGQVYPKVLGLIVKIRRKKDPVYIPWNNVRRTSLADNIVIDFTPETIQAHASAGDTEILLKKSFMDRQLISTSGHKVVRVNDLQLLLESSTKGNPYLWLVHVDIGIKGLLRRLGFVGAFNMGSRFLLDRDLKDKFISWKNVQPTSTTSLTGSLQLKMDPSKLSEIHPADLADIVEDLGLEERAALLESLDPLTAASALQEIPLRIRVQIAETLEMSKLAALVNETQLDEAVDLLDELSPEIRSAVLLQLPPEKTAELKELSKLSVYGVGSIMNTDFITARPTQTVQQVLEIVREESEKTELLHYVYIQDSDGKLKGVVTLRQLLSLDADVIMADIMWESVVTATIETNVKRVAKIFFKYNFVALPVVDDDGVMQGIITMRDALESVYPEMKDEAHA